MANTTHSASEATAEAAGHAAESAGMPQLNFEHFPNQIFWLLVTLVLIYFILSRVVLPRIGGILADRQGKITNDIAAAEELRARAVEAEKSYNQALIDARAEADKIIAEARAAIQSDLDKAIAKADAEIAARSAESSKRIDEVRATATESVAEVARDAAEALVQALGGKADAKTVADAVSDRLKG